MCVPNSPSGEGASLAVRRKSVGARAWGSEPPLPPASSPCARAGLCAHGSSPRGARGADAVSNRAALSGAACAGWAPRVARGDAGRAGRSATGGCRAVPLAERRGDVRVRARGAALSPPPALSRGGAIGGGVVCCRWRTTGGQAGARERWRAHRMAREERKRRPS